MFGHENEARGRGALTASEMSNLVKNSTTGVLDMDDDMTIANEEIIDNIGLDEGTTELERPNQEAEASSNASLARRRSGTESLQSDRPRQRRKMDPFQERLCDMVGSITQSLAAPVVMKNEGQRAIGEAIGILSDRFSKESSALHMHMGEIWSAEPNRAIAFVKSPKKSQKGLSRRKRRPWAQWNWKMIPMFWAVIDGSRKELW